MDVEHVRCPSGRARCPGMNTPRRITIALTGVLLLTSCGSNTAEAYSFTKAVQAADTATRYRAETTLTVDGVEQLRSECDIDTASAAMRCTMDAAGESTTVLVGLESGVMYVSAASIVGSDAPAPLPPGVQWVQVPIGGSLTATPESQLDASSVLTDPLAQVGALAEVETTEAPSVTHDGDTLQGFQVSLDAATAAAFMPDTEGRTADDSGATRDAMQFTFYVNEASELRGFRAALSDDESAGLVEVWISPSSTAPIELPEPDAVMDLQTLMETMLGGALEGALEGALAGDDPMGGLVSESADQVLANTAESIARETNARAGGAPTADDLAQVIAEFSDAAPEWTVSTADEIRVRGCAEISRDFAGTRSTASILLPPGAQRAAIAPGPCRV